ncbi:Cytochrome c oxidase biogenesis protein Cmc1-like [Lasallia pustulata]|uniref:COX assembly mitochondrial protein n=1 Tax=Lasallia pustulata TaxID=136370 RepID=A0A1W5D4H7_9LECA|nr:Cytochrome c oxidase biogenesis protein Cmc1-like [Lasallia pustulata]
MMATTKPESHPLPSRNPLPLSAAQEGQVRDLYYKRVRGKCANEIRDFASCAMNRTISATWACRSERLAMNSCMVLHATQQEQDAAREEWFATIDVRARQRAEKEKKRKEQEKFHREWWGLPPLPDEAGPDRDDSVAAKPRER